MIDIRDLRIGSSVLFNGERVKVEGIVIQNGVVFFENDNAYADMLDPIPITEELLKELGFKKSAGSYYKHLDNSICLSYNIYSETFIIWLVENGKFVSDLASMSLCGQVHHYLHELEAFVYLTTKQELI